MMERRVWAVILVTVTTVAFTTGVVLTIGLPRPAEIPPPLEGGALQFEVLRPTYSIGENVTFAVTNYLNHSVCLMNTAPWKVQRHFEGEWRVVDSHSHFAAVVTLRFGESYMWRWTAATSPYEQELGMPPVEPGNYRVLLPVVLDCEGWSGSVMLSTYFQLVS
jgi:hypothetical protein